MNCNACLERYLPVTIAMVSLPQKHAAAQTLVTPDDLAYGCLAGRIKCLKMAGIGMLYLLGAFIMDIAISIFIYFCAQTTNTNIDTHLIVRIADTGLAIPASMISGAIILIWGLLGAIIDPRIVISPPAPQAAPQAAPQG